MSIDTETYSVCSDCVQAIANGEFSQLDNHPETADQRQAAIVAGMERLGGWLYPDAWGESEFSRSRCECCRAPEHGDRYTVTAITQETGPEPPTALEAVDEIDTIITRSAADDYVDTGDALNVLAFARLALLPHVKK
jgi:hypothetical protein